MPRGPWRWRLDRNDGEVAVPGGGHPPGGVAFCIIRLSTDKYPSFVHVHYVHCASGEADHAINDAAYGGVHATWFVALAR